MQRLATNPLLAPKDVAPTRSDLTVLCTLNPAAVRFGEEILLLVRVAETAPPTEDAVATVVYSPEKDDVQTVYISRGDPELDASDPRKFAYQGRLLLTSLSHLRVARSRDGEHFRFDDKPAIFPATPYESYGCEDARITPIDGVYWIAYTAVSPMGVCVALASTVDFRTFNRHGIIFPTHNKDVAILPQKVAGLFVCRHRPYRTEFNDAAIWTAYSPDLLHWGSHQVTLSPQPDTWMSNRVGAGAPPIRTDAGWLDIFHGVDRHRRYCLGAMLTDLDHPERLISCSSHPVLIPEAPYELTGLLNEVVFSNGVIADSGGRLVVFYGAADSICAAAVTTVDEMIAAARS